MGQRIARWHYRCLGGMRDEFDVLFVVPRNISGLLGSFEFQMVLADDGVLDLIATSLIDRVGDIRVKLIRGPFDILQILGTTEPFSALIAVVAAHVVLRATAAASGRHFAARHGHERTVCSLDDFQIPDHKSMVKSDRAEGSESVLRVFHELDSYLGNVHLDVSLSPLNRLIEDRWAGPCGKWISPKVPFPLQLCCDGLGLSPIG